MNHDLKHESAPNKAPAAQVPGAWMWGLLFLEKWGYVTVGLSFLVVGMVSFANAWYAFWVTVQSGVLKSAVVLTNDLLFVLILLELFRTVINFLRSQVITLEPFLYIGVIAGMRRILTSGSDLTDMHLVSTEVFQRYLWDVGLNVVIVIVLVLAIFLYRSRIESKKLET